jgi:alpha-glucosidase (family GH31 glycosyl hydrolase)
MEAREDETNRRPIIFSRWGGLGNHRYQIGFSGDTFCNWPSLAFQPFFTATAGNVGFAYWSHDIGGHQPGPVDPELYARWIQYGIFSPILRTHTTKNTDAERRIWKFPPEIFDAMRKAFHLRYELIPYIYTMPPATATTRRCRSAGRSTTSGPTSTKPTV